MGRGWKHPETLRLDLAHIAHENQPQEQHLHDSSEGIA